MSDEPITLTNDVKSYAPCTEKYSWYGDNINRNTHSSIAFPQFQLLGIPGETHKGLDHTIPERSNYHVGVIDYHPSHSDNTADVESDGFQKKLNLVL